MGWRVRAAMEQLSSWIAPIATTIAACMTAANLGTRVTGWGFVVFTIGSLAWTSYGAVTGQSNLVWQNLFLTAINLVGVWRWLGRRARLDEGARTAAEASEHQEAPTLFPVSALTGAPLLSAAGETIGATVDAMARCRDGRIDYLVVGSGGVGGLGETLHALPWADVTVEPDRIMTDARIDRLRLLDPSHWPARLSGGPDLETGS
ncbi:PRC-barrel domain-containing protein [Sphingomonas sp.]|uniref:PRC-barrel domain-containing protein n=1 Tax=Sphingomonas sp. TaxID=28214 RepID=UPI002DBCFFF4|nr:PRC-barrel domain-containing protein [Sphingomonas sp.]HEU4969163.1 PRC-barrel domain-containing protein [Sphingomonas sp.]